MRLRIDDAFDYKGIAKRRPTMLRSMQDGQHDHDFCMRGQGNITAEKLPELDTAGIVALVSNEAPPLYTLPRSVDWVLDEKATETTELSWRVDHARDGCLQGVISMVHSDVCSCIRSNDLLCPNIFPSIAP